MVTGLLHLNTILKDIEIKRQELNSMVYNIADYHSDVILGKSQELDKLIVEFYEKSNESKTLGKYKRGEVTMFSKATIGRTTLDIGVYTCDACGLCVCIALSESILKKTKQFRHR